MEGDKKKPQLFAGRRRIGPQSTILLAFIALAIGYFSSNSLAYWLGSGGEARRDFQTMNTYARIVIPSRSGASIPAEQVADLAEAAVRQVNDLMGPYGEHSDVRRLNSVGRNQWISVNPLTWRVVMEALRWHRLSNGAFDPTIGPVKALFHFDQSEADDWPDEETLADARSKIGADKLLFDREGMRLAWAEDGMRLDLGAIAKGFSADVAMETLVRNGVQHGLVEVGGELRLLGGKPGKDNPPWRTGLKDPRPQADHNHPGSDTGASGTTMVVEVHDAGIATSGDYESFLYYQGQRYHHIIDPRTGLPLVSTPGSVVAVTAIHPDSCLAADALATTLTVMGEEEGKQFLKDQALGLFSKGIKVIMYVQTDDPDRLREVVVTIDERGNYSVSE